MTQAEWTILMTKINEEKVLARGLKGAGVLLLVKKRLAEDGEKPRYLRVIISSVEAVDELSDYLEKLGIKTERDRAGNDYHLIADLKDLKHFKDVD